MKELEIIKDLLNTAQDMMDAGEDVNTVVACCADIVALHKAMEIKANFED